MRHGALLFLCTAALLSGCKKHRTPDAAASSAPSASGAASAVAMSPQAMLAAGVKTAPVARSTLTPKDEMPGTIEAPRDAVVMINAKAPGVIQSLDVDEGDKVTAHQRVATIWSRELAQAQADYGRARIAEQHASEALKRTTDLENQGLLSPRRLADDRLTWQDSQLARRAASERIRILGGAPGGAEGKITITSPMAGTVSARKANRGEAVAENAPLVTVIDLSRLIVEIRAPVGDGVEPGTRVTFTAEGLSDKSFSATVKSVGPALDPETRRVPIRCTLDDAEKALEPGMFVTARVPRKTVEGLTIPESAVLVTDGGATVFVANNGRFVQRSIELGARADGRVMVQSGLVEHEQVVVEGAFQVRSELQKSTLEE
jgi:membrane fusion protein, heavy metal efflux system